MKFHSAQPVCQKLPYNSYMPDLAAHLIEQTEMERREFARQLHDKTGQELTALNIQLSVVDSWLQKGQIAEAKSKLLDAIEIVNQISAHLRELMCDLYPPTLDEYGLLAALHDFLSQAAPQAGVTFSLEGEEPSPALSTRESIAFFRIAQDVFRLADGRLPGSHLKISLEQAAAVFRLVFQIDPAGGTPEILNDEDLESPLARIRERARQIDACAEIRFEPGNQIRVTVEAAR